MNLFSICRENFGAMNLKFVYLQVSGVTDGKKALYHCNYCNKDISGKIRIKCVICSDFDLCIECFSVGAEVHPHKSSHPYRVMVRNLLEILSYLSSITEMIYTWAVFFI